MSETVSERRLDYVSQLPDGSGPVISITIFRGMLIAATEEGVYYLDGSEWRRLEIAPKGEKA